MDARTRLLNQIRAGSLPLLSPRPLAHSQELKEQLPLVRGHVGPRPWYSALEASAGQAQSAQR